MIRLVIWFTLLNFVYGQSVQLTNLTVNCDENGMQIKMEFDSPFNGIVYSKNYFKDENCRFVKPYSNNNVLDFEINKSSNCGIIENKVDSNEGLKEYRNTIVIQKNSDYQSRYDVVKTLICSWFNNFETSITRKPFNVHSLPEEEQIFKEKSEVFIDVRKDEDGNPFKKSLEGLVLLGQKLTISIGLVDPKNNFDLKAKNCFLYDRNTFSESRKINLTNDQGCSYDSDLFTGFYKADNIQNDDEMKDMITKSQNPSKLLETNKILIGFLNAVKFPEVSNVFISCKIEICRNQCESHCQSPYKIKNITKEKNYLTDTTTVVNSNVYETTTVYTTANEFNKESITTLKQLNNPEITTSLVDLVDVTMINKSSDDNKEMTTVLSRLAKTKNKIKTTRKQLYFNEEANKLSDFEKRLSLDYDQKENTETKKLNYNKNGLIINNVDQSTIDLLEKVQENEIKRVKKNVKKRLTIRSINDEVNKNRNNKIKSILIEKPNESLAKITFQFEENLKNFPLVKSSRKARYMKHNTIILDNLILTKPVNI